jgi:hypothetical protein
MTGPLPPLRKLGVEPFARLLGALVLRGVETGEPQRVVSLVVGEEESPSASSAMLCDRSSTTERASAAPAGMLRTSDSGTGPPIFRLAPYVATRWAIKAQPDPYRPPCSGLQARYYFGMNPDPSLEEIREAADHYPVFRVVGGEAN